MKHYISFVSLLALATPAFAEEAPFDLSAEDRGGSANSIVVTASRSGDGVLVKELGSSVTILDAEAFEQRQTRVVSDILRDVPGVAVSRVGGISSTTQVRLRGTEGNHVLVLIDGIEASDPYQGEFDFGTLIADPAARIEVLRGQQSSLYGSDAIGGVIQYITLTGREAPGVSARAEGGSFGTLSGSARVAGVSGDLDYALSGTYFHTDGWPTARNGTRDIASDNAGVSGKLIWTPADNLKLIAVARYSQAKAEENTTEDNPASPLFGYIVDSPGLHFRLKGFYGLLRGEFSALEGLWTTALTGQIADTRRRSYNEAGLNYGNNGRRLKGSLESSLRLGTDTVGHRLTAAVDVEQEEFQNKTPGTGSPFDAFVGKRHTENLGLVGQYEVLVNDALSVGASIRHDRNDRFDDPTTWRVQGSYAFSTGTRVRAAYGTGVKNPGYFDLYGYSDGNYIGNPGLRPEKSRGWEAGIEQQLDEGSTIGVTYFDSKLKDEIFITYPAPNFIATPANRDTRSSQHGFEVFASARPIPQLRLDATYTYLKASENGVVEVRRPRHIGSFNATIFSNDERFSGTLTVRYNGRQEDVAYIDPSYIPVSVTLDEFVLVNLNAEYKITPAVTVFGRVENLINERYEEVFSFATAGRAAYGGVRVNF